MPSRLPREKEIAPNENQKQGANGKKYLKKGANVNYDPRKEAKKGGPDLSKAAQSKIDCWMDNSMIDEVPPFIEAP